MFCKILIYLLLSLAKKTYSVRRNMFLLLILVISYSINILHYVFMYHNINHNNPFSGKTIYSMKFLFIFLYVKYVYCIIHKKNVILIFIYLYQRLFKTQVDNIFI